MGWSGRACNFRVNAMLVLRHFVKIVTTCNGSSTVARCRALPVTIAEPLRTVAHHFPPKLPRSPLSPHSQSLSETSTQDACTAYVRNCHQDVRGSLHILFSLLLCSNSIYHVSGLNAYISRPFGPLS